MAYIIFDKGSNQIGRIAKDQSFMENNKGWNDEHVDVVEINDTDFNNFKQGITNFVSRDGNNITWETINPPIKFTHQSDLQAQIQNIVNHIDKWFETETNKNRPMANDVTTYKQVLENIDVSALITDPSADATQDESFNYSDGTPLNKSLEKHVIDQGQTAFHPLELL